MRESTVQEEKQPQEVTVHQDITVQVEHEWLNSFHARTVLIIQNLESGGKTNVVTALRGISVRKEQCSLCPVL